LRATILLDQRCVFRCSDVPPPCRPIRQSLIFPACCTWFAPHSNLRHFYTTITTTRLLCPAHQSFLDITLFDPDWYLTHNHIGFLLSRSPPWLLKPTCVLLTPGGRQLSAPSLSDTITALLLGQNTPSQARRLKAPVALLQVTSLMSARPTLVRAATPTSGLTAPTTMPIAKIAQLSTVSLRYISLSVARC
jgi:hypothetical protein